MCSRCQVISPPRNISMIGWVDMELSYQWALLGPLKPSSMENSISIYILGFIYTNIKMSKFQSFALTIRPRGGILKDGPLQKALETWLENWDYQLYAYEMEGESRHLHAQIFTNDPKRRSDICRRLERIQAKHDPDWSLASKRVLFSGIKVAYNDKYLDYILKEQNETPEGYIEVLSKSRGSGSNSV